MGAERDELFEFAGDWWRREEDSALELSRLQPPLPIRYV